jgi:hypothetical protein
MKKISYLFFVFLLLVPLTFFTSCEDEEDGAGTTNPLEVEVTQNQGATLAPGTDVTFSISMTTNEKLKELEILVSVGGTSGTPEIRDLDNDRSRTETFNYTIPESAAGQEVVITFTVTDSEEQVGKTASFVVDYAKIEVSDAAIYHILGPNQGAWDLMENKGVSEGGQENRYLGDNKDMINREPSGTTPKDDFLHEIVAGNETRFVKDNNFDYANASLVSAAEAYEAGDPAGKGQTGAGATEWNSHDPVELEVGDILIANIRGLDQYAVIKITDISGSASSDGVIEFTYKKRDPNFAKNAGKDVPFVYF